jgi:hypothetical protein
LTKSIAPQLRYLSKIPGRCDKAFLVNSEWLRFSLAWPSRGKKLQVVLR